VALAAATSDPLSQLDQPGRILLYQTLAGVSGALLGFGITAAAIVFALSPGPRMLALRRSWGEQLNAQTMGSLGILALCTIGFAGAIAFDSAKEASGARYVVVALTVMAVLRVGRLLWVMVALLAVANRETADAVERPPIETWTPPDIQPGDYSARSRTSAGTRTRGTG
jgi:hypothetical protein